MVKSTDNTDNPLFQLSPQALRLPRLLESDPRGKSLLRLLFMQTQLLWQEGELETPVVPPSTGLATALRHAHRVGRVVQSLEKAERILAAEERGLRLVAQSSGAAEIVRISRLLVLADDGAERFYRQVERLLRRHGPRVLAVRLRVDAEGLGELAFGSNRRARLLMINHKEAVSSVLLAMADLSTLKLHKKHDKGG